jgi:endonuclease/exonuclease/phosphatase family metal-dependent hydrolase
MMTPLRRAAVAILLALFVSDCAKTRRLPGAPSAACRAVVTIDRGTTPPAVRWQTPDGVRDRDLLATGCGTVGPAIARRGPGGVAPEAGVMPVLVSWNVHVGGGRVREFVEHLRAGRFTGGRSVRHFVLLLQEAYRAGALVPPLPAGAVVPRRIGSGGPADDISTLAADLDLALFYVPSMRNGVAERPHEESDRGNAILSTLPLSDLTAIELPFVRQRRVAVAATILLWLADGPRPARVVSAHLATRLDTVPRTRQARHLIEALGSARPDLPMLVGADLNTFFGPDEEAFRRLRHAFPQTPRVPRRPTLAWGWIFPVDYLLFRLPAGWEPRYRVLTDAFGSDHYPLVGTISIADDDQLPTVRQSTPSPKGEP